MPTTPGAGEGRSKHSRVVACPTHQGCASCRSGRHRGCGACRVTAYTPDQSAFTETRFASAGPLVVLPRSAVRAVHPFTVSRKSGISIVAAAVTHRARHLEILEVVRLKAEPLRRHEVPRIAHLAVGQESVASGIGGVCRAGSRSEWRREGLGGRLRAPNVSQIHRCAVRRPLAREVPRTNPKFCGIAAGLSRDALSCLK